MEDSVLLVEKKRKALEWKSLTGKGKNKQTKGPYNHIVKDT